MKTHHLALILWGLVVASNGAQAQTTQWTNAGTGSWFVAANWDNGVPVAGGNARVDNGGTTQIISASTAVLTSVGAGVNSSAFTGFIEITNGDLTASSVVYLGNVGTGHLTQSGASTLTTQTLCMGCSGTQSDGTLILDGGTVDVSSALYVANTGTAYLEQNGATTITAQSLCVGCNGSQSDGTYVLNDGTATATAVMYVGHVGIGLVTQNGGTINAPNVILAGQPSGNATWDMNSGGLNVTGLLYVGSMGAGQFTQIAPTTVTVGTGVRIADSTGSSGTYALAGGTLTAGYIHRGPAATGVFTMTGGRLSVGEFGSVTTGFPLTVGGGTLAPNDLSPGTTTVHGDYTQNGAASLEVQLNGTSTALFDRLVVIGGVTLNNGLLDVSLGFAPTLGDTFLILDNDDVDPVVGTFAGLPEGATITLVFNLIPYDLQISYVGGTGNDVVLTVQEPSCVEPPVGMVAWWPLDEVLGTTAEELVNGNDGTHANGPTPLVSEHVGNSLCFDGIDDYVEVPDAPELDFGTGDFSIDAWVKTTNTSGVRVIVEKREDPASPPGVIGYSIYVYNGEFGFQLADGDGTNSCACTVGAACTNFGSGPAGFVADGLWHHVAVTLNRTDPVADGGIFYVDGAPVGNFEPLCRPESISNASPLRIGRQTPFGGGDFDGCIDEVELFDRELTPAEVSAIFAAGVLGKCKCDCPADVNGDGFVDGLDIAAFTHCALQIPTAGEHCSCADMTGDGIVDQDDVPPFVAALLNGGPCL